MANNKDPKAPARAKAAMRKRRENPDYRQLSIGGEAAVIDRFIAALDATGEPTRIRQLAVFLDAVQKTP